MYQIYNLTDSPNVRVTSHVGPFTVIEHMRDLSVNPAQAQSAYYESKMNIRRHQLICELSKSSVVVQAGSMQWIVGNVNATSGVKGVGDFISKKIRSKVTKESAVKPEYGGDGLLVLEPTNKHILLIDLDSWNGSIVLEDGLFLACTASLEQRINARTNLSSAVAGNEGMFNLCLVGKGIAALESTVPMEELVEVDLQDDVLKVDGNFAIAWSSSLSFTVERSAKSLVGSALNQEGLVNVYRGTGKVLLAPVMKPV